MKNSFKTVLTIVAIMVTQIAFSQKTKADKAKVFDNKKYTVQFYELKAAGRGKTLPSTVELHSGKISSELMEEKIKLEDTKFHIVLDSTYKEDDDELRYIKLEAATTKEKDDYKWEVTINNYDIEGTVTQSKGGLEKKKFEFSGTEKTK